MKIVFRLALPALMGTIATLAALEGCLNKEGFSDGVACESAAQCGQASPCATYTCAAQVCKTSYAPAGTKLPDTTKGDCQRPECDGHGAIVEAPDPSDVPASTASCVLAACGADGGILHSFAMAGTACSAGTGAHVCDGTGKCVACIQASDCPATGDYCYDNACASCSDGTQDGDETGVDCGGSHCLKCNGDACSQPAECASMNCAGAATGGKCGWPAGVPCQQDTQCASLKCTSGTCTAP